MSKQFDDTEQGSSYSQGISIAWLLTLDLLPLHRTKMGPQLFGIVHMLSGGTIGFVLLSYGCPELRVQFLAIYIVACIVNAVSYRIAKARGENINIRHCGTSILELVFDRSLAFTLEPWLKAVAGLVLIYGFQHNFGVFLLMNAIGQRMCRAHWDSFYHTIVEQTLAEQDEQEWLMDEINRRRGERRGF